MNALRLVQSGPQENDETSKKFGVFFNLRYDELMEVAPIESGSCPQYLKNHIISGFLSMQFYFQNWSTLCLTFCLI